jgi:hypothetical protein
MPLKVTASRNIEHHTSIATTLFKNTSEIKRRLSSSSVENDEEDELELQAAIGVTDPTKVHKQVRMLDQIDKDSSIAHVLKQNLIEESERKQKGIKN